MENSLLTTNCFLVLKSYYVLFFQKFAWGRMLGTIIDNICANDSNSPSGETKNDRKSAENGSLNYWLLICIRNYVGMY
jgi:hypothetical protein